MGENGHGAANLIPGPPALASEAALDGSAGLLEPHLLSFRGSEGLEEGGSGTSSSDSACSAHQRLHDSSVPDKD